MSQNPFATTPISRRQFVRLSAATGGTLALPGAASADVSSSSFDAEYQYLLNHTPKDYEVPTLVTFEDAASLRAIETIAPEARTTTAPRPAAHASLTTNQAERVADLPTAETLHFSPGANPFWRLGHYPLGVFPEPERSTDFIDYEEVEAGSSTSPRSSTTGCGCSRSGGAPTSSTRSPTAGTPGTCSWSNSPRTSTIARPLRRSGRCCRTAPSTATSGPAARRRRGSSRACSAANTPVSKLCSTNWRSSSRS